MTTELNPYRGITKENYYKVREILMKAIESPQTPYPHVITKQITEETGMPLDESRALVQEEFVMAMGWTKNEGRDVDRH